MVEEAIATASSSYPRLLLISKFAMLDFASTFACVDEFERHKFYLESIRF